MSSEPPTAGVPELLSAPCGSRKAQDTRWPEPVSITETESRAQRWPRGEPLSPSLCGDTVLTAASGLAPHVGATPQSTALGRMRLRRQGPGGAVCALRCQRSNFTPSHCLTENTNVGFSVLAPPLPAEGRDGKWLSVPKLLSGLIPESPTAHLPGGELDGSRLSHCARQRDQGAARAGRGSHAGSLCSPLTESGVVNASRVPTAAVTGSSQSRPLSVWQGPLENDLVVHVALIAESQRYGAWRAA